MKNKKIAIIGFGKEGKDAHKYLIALGCKNITICDQNKSLKGVKGAKLQLGKDYLDEIGSFDIIFRSPGVPFLHVQKLVHNYVQKSGGKIPLITSVTKYFFQHCKAKIIGVTGTKGKGTTSALVHNMLKTCGKLSYLAGNIGTPPLSLLNKLKKTDYVVLELSSFQLQDLTQSPNIAVVLMITKDHLDVHKSVNEYHDAKKNIVKHQKSDDLAVINNMFKANQVFLKLGKGKKIIVNTLEKANGISSKANNTCSVKDGSFVLNIDGKEQKLCSVDEAKLLGKHNWQNICAAAAAVSTICPIKAIVKVIKTFKGLPHRLQIVHKSDGVTYINDTFSTTPETTIAAINAVKKPTILILGGSKKGSNYNDLAKEIIKARHITKVIFLGNEAAIEIKTAIEKANKQATENIKQLDSAGDKKTKIYRDILLKMSQAKNMQEAILSAKIDTKQDSIVLLSPAAASFDLFKNYKERGKCFTEAVKKLTK